MRRIMFWMTTLVVIGLAVSHYGLKLI
jgi:hypothetical protein